VAGCCEQNIEHSYCMKRNIFLTRENISISIRTVLYGDSKCDVILLLYLLKSRPLLVGHLDRERRTNNYDTNLVRNLFGPLIVCSEDLCTMAVSQYDVSGPILENGISQI